ncbi:MAG: hypothetical protein A2900_01820 [Candidatus Chisholmbacteria bacterium RIFCSPLOWO2_01_FULL_50_28]|uniref:Uncharacterized protein n=1 Tax=Candidatus Chisholmbacteria bacterium RIFCSPHIGHO2_01_FULL_52_32 TaxID=1797591 RepID=A0A1G1VTU1_9BACT|nr:MAG: hypothetical protein A2786_04925 [Candidatus Chisholmbacteria bacterium RIFCSPHIGHO2_01_FULL_52_32]OGY19821.1 MAG: hypothetical protein A2900_01820 [Candidatus Chisholmbacteria bacterium RIFCSPLOWO2_01_FULL_50_28]
MGGETGNPPCCNLRLSRLSSLTRKQDAFSIPRFLSGGGTKFEGKERYHQSANRRITESGLSFLGIDWPFLCLSKEMVERKDTLGTFLQASVRSELCHPTPSG